MTQPIIKVENLSKMYRLGTIGTGTLTHDLKRWYYKMRGLEDPYMKIGEENKRDLKSKNDYVWALKDINFEVQPGEVLGIIGKNGAGKSTLLKILSKITGPTTGSIHHNGRIGALLEVGTGFHPELTGRENIFLNGAILGMTKVEIRGKIDEIIDFSGVEKYIDTPVKRYSSGMMVRLGFAVAAHLEPEILIIDEVLSVGDAEFQKRAIGKIDDMAKGGRTVLFVSHNMGAVSSICQRVLVLNDGCKVIDDKAETAIKMYLGSDVDACRNGNWKSDHKACKKHISLLEVSICDLKGDFRNVFTSQEEVFVEVKMNIPEQLAGLRISLDIEDRYEKIIARSFHNDICELFSSSDFRHGVHFLQVKIPKQLLTTNSYYISIGACIHNVKWLFNLKRLVQFDIEIDVVNRKYFAKQRVGIIAPMLKWKLIEG